MATSDDKNEPDNMTGGEGPVAVDWKLLQTIPSIKPQQQKAERDKTIVCTADHNTSKSSAAKVHYDNQLFILPPKSEDCPTCGLILPQLESGKRYQPCCGKLVCSGCLSEAVLEAAPALPNCPYCKTPAPRTAKEALRRTKKRVDTNHYQALVYLGVIYHDGLYGLPRDYKKALQLWMRAGKLGCTKAYNNVGYAYWHGHGVKRNRNKARHYYELAVMGGDVNARCNLAEFEELQGNMNMSLKHHMIAVRGGEDGSLSKIREYYKNGYATKHDYAKALQCYQSYLDEVKSNQRDKATNILGDDFRSY